MKQLRKLKDFLDIEVAAQSKDHFTTNVHY